MLGLKLQHLLFRGQRGGGYDYIRFYYITKCPTFQEKERILSICGSVSGAFVYANGLKAFPIILIMCAPLLFALATTDCSVSSLAVTPRII